MEKDIRNVYGVFKWFTISQISEMKKLKLLINVIWYIDNNLQLDWISLFMMLRIKFDWMTGCNMTQHKKLDVIKNLLHFLLKDFKETKNIWKCFQFLKDGIIALSSKTCKLSSTFDLIVSSYAFKSFTSEMRVKAFQPEKNKISLLYVIRYGITVLRIEQIWNNLLISEKEEKEMKIVLICTFQWIRMIIIKKCSNDANKTIYLHISLNMRILFMGHIFFHCSHRIHKRKSCFRHWLLRFKKNACLKMTRYIHNA